MRLKITMRQAAPKPAKAGTSTTQSNKRKCQDIENPQGKPSRPTKVRRIAKVHERSDGPSKLETLPSELQHLIYTKLFQSDDDKDQTPAASPTKIAATDSSKEIPRLSNVTSILRVSKKTNVEAAQAFYDTVTRPINVWRSDIREAIDRAITQTDRRLTRAQVAADEELQNTLKYRHIHINVQLEFEEDRACLQNFKTLLPKIRDHVISLDLNLGFIDSHGPFDENGLIFKEKGEVMKKIATDLLSWKGSRCKVKMSYRTGCICGSNRRFPSFMRALEHLEKETNNNNVPFTHTEGFPKGWPRWEDRSDQNGNWNWSRGRIMRRMGIESA